MTASFLLLDKSLALEEAMTASFLLLGKSLALEEAMTASFLLLGKSLGLEEAMTAPFLHAKTTSITGSLNSSDSLHSDSSLSYPSSGLRKGGAEGSEADSERDSVSPQRHRDEVSPGLFVVLSL